MNTGTGQFRFQNMNSIIYSNIAYRKQYQLPNIANMNTGRQNSDCRFQNMNN